MSPISLVDAPTRTGFTLSRANGTPAVCRRLAALGLRRGAHLEVIHRSVGGALVVAVADSRIALGKELAACLVVEPR